MKKVSIITAMYNGEKFIKQMINSVLLQTYENWELIIIDNYSNDNTEEVIKNFSDKKVQVFGKLIMSSFYSNRLTLEARRVDF